MDEFQGQNCLEFSSVTGVVYLSIDQQPFIVQRFTEYIKAWVILDEEPYLKHKSKFSGTGSNTCGLSKGSEIPAFQTEPGNEPTVSTGSFEVDVHEQLRTERFEDSHSSFSPVKQLDQNSKNCIIKDSELMDGCNKNKRSKMKSSVMSTGKSPGNSLGLAKKKISLPDSRHIGAHQRRKSLDFDGNSNGKSHVSCKYCLKDFKNQRAFYDHRKSSRLEHICDVCQKVFPFKAYLLVHQSSHAKSVTEDLEQSDFPFEFETDHTKMLQSSEKSLKNNLMCEVCGAMMANSCILKTHMMLHTGENAYRCCVCGKEFNSIGSFSHHMVTHEKTGKVQCKICNLGFDSRTELSKHQLIHGSRCSLCGVSFPNKTSRAFHYREYHKEEILKCDRCEKLFSSDIELKAHLKYHQNRKKTQCTVCGRLVSRLSDHMLSHSSPTAAASVYVCDKCPKVFVKKLSFQRHLKTHSEERPYKCLHCPKQFSRSGGLSRHMLIHCQEKPFLCPVCGREFTQKGNLKTHMLVHKDS